MQRRLTEIGWSAARTLYLLPARLMRSMRFLLNDVRIAGGSYIAPQAVIGRRTRINAASYVGPCVIGSYCAIGGRLVVRSGNHDTGFLNLQDHAQRRIIRSDHTVIGVSKGGVRIGHGVWIGDSVIILPGVQIGNGAVIGAGSVVTKSVPPYAIAAGNPARVLRHRFTPEALDLFKDLEWWTWDDSRLRANKWLFESDFSKPVDAATAERIRRLSENPDQ